MYGPISPQKRVQTHTRCHDTQAKACSSQFFLQMHRWLVAQFICWAQRQTAYTRHREEVRLLSTFCPLPSGTQLTPTRVWETGVYSPEVSFPALLGTFTLALTDAYGKDSLAGR